MRITHIFIVFLALFLLLTTSCFKTELNIKLDGKEKSVESSNAEETQEEEETEEQENEETEKEEEEEQENDLPEGIDPNFCGFDGFDSCSSDDDCHILGRYQHICAGINREDMPIGSAWKECYDHNVYKKECECKNSMCEWD